MHDTGKIGIPDRILKAPRRLTADEWQIMQTHTEIGHRILSKSRSPLFQLAADIALCHHERWDGSGYPRGLAGEQIPQAARIVAIADVFDALTMQRPYKQAWSVEKALATMQAESERHFDPQLLRRFFDIKAEILTIRERWNVEESRPGDPTLTDRRRSNSR